jgi:hypothetical protein
MSTGSSASAETCSLSVGPCTRQLTALRRPQSGQFKNAFASIPAAHPEVVGADGDPPAGPHVGTLSAPY